MFYQLFKYTLLFTMFGFVCSNNIQAQNYQPILEPNAIWTQGVNGGFFSPLVTYGYEKLRLQGDTAINGADYKKMYKTSNEASFNASTATYNFAIREDDNGKVWIVEPNTTDEILYMDFALEAGQTGNFYGNNLFAPGPSNTIPILIVEKDSIMIGSDWRDRLLVQLLPDQYCYNEYWIEGIGNTGGFLRNTDPCFISDIGWKNIICHELGGQVDYQAAGTNTCKEPYPLTILGDPFQDQTICTGQTATIESDVFFNIVDGGVGPYSYSVVPDVGVENVTSYGVSVNPTETTSYTYVVTDLFGNSVGSEFTVNVLEEVIEPVDILVSSFSNDCYVDSLLLTSSSVYAAYQWTDIYENVVGNGPNLVIYEPGNYYLEVSNEVGCTNNDVQPFLFQDPLNTNPNPEIVFNPSTPCDGDVVTISTKESYTTYLWSTGETTASIQVPVQVGTFNSISVQVTNEFGCMGPNIPTTIGFGANPYPDAPPTIVLEGGLLTAETTGTIGTYQWFLNGEPIEDANDAHYIPIESGLYSVAVSTSIYELACPAFSGSLYADASQRPLELKVILEGAYDPTTGLMSTNLLDAGLLPNSQPYEMAPWNYDGGEGVYMIPENTVDWVLVEARSGTLDLVNAGTTVVETHAAFLLSDGSIVNLAGGTLFFYNLGDGADYHIAVRHRNHLDIISAMPSPSNATIFHDFTVSAEEAFGPSQLKEMTDGKFAMYAADMNPNGVILNTDYDAWTENPAVNQIYNLTDANLDGVVQATDFDLWFVNRSKLGTVEIQY